MVNHMVYHSTLDATFAALADPTRREILSRLAVGERSISDLAGRFDMSLPAVSKHIRVLERAGLARVRRDGRTRRTALVAAPMRDAQEWIEKYRQFWEFQFDQLAAYLEASTDPKETHTWQPRSQSRTRRSRSGERSTHRGSASSTRGRKPKK
jgi:DNA-binding transcriptional ArsR family regulator